MKELIRNNLLWIYKWLFFFNELKKCKFIFPKKLLIPNQYIGLGDIIFQQSLVRKYIDQGYKVLWPVKKHFVNDLNRAYPDIAFVNKSIVKANYNAKHEINKQRLKILPLRWADMILNLPPDDCMKAKYMLYKEDWHIWKQHAQWKRDVKKENELFNLLGLTQQEQYILVNRTYQSAFQSKAKFDIVTSTIVIEMNLVEGYSLFDWAMVIEHATEIHTVSTSLLYLLELLDLKQPIHLYPRKNDPQFDHVRFLFTKPYILH